MCNGEPCPVCRNTGYIHDRIERPGEAGELDVTCPVCRRRLAEEQTPYETQIPIGRNVK